MEDCRDDAGDGRAPHGGEILALLVIVPAVAAAARALGDRGLATPWVSAIVVGVCAGTIGLPALVWVFERGYRRFSAVAGVGLGAGVVPPLLMLASGAMGLYWRGGVDNVEWVLRHGASIPFYGTLAWHRYLSFLAWSAVVGAGSAAVYWLMVFSGRAGRPTTWGLVAAVFVVVAGLGALFGQ